MVLKKKVSIRAETLCHRASAGVKLFVMNLSFHFVIYMCISLKKIMRGRKNWGKARHSLLSRKVLTESTEQNLIHINLLV